MAGGKWKLGRYVPDRDNKWADNIHHNVIGEAKSDGRPIGLEHGYRRNIRVPSLKRNNYTWKNFYRNYKGLWEYCMETDYWLFLGHIKLKKITVL